MKLILFLLLGFSLQVTAQVVAIENDINAVFYVGYANKVIVVAEGIENRNLILETDNGEIETGNEPGTYLYFPTHAGQANIIISHLNGKDTIIIFEKQYRAESFPGPYPTFAGKKGGEITRAEAGAQIAPLAFVFGGGKYGCAKYVIDTFEMIVSRNSNVIYSGLSTDHNGARMSDLKGAKQILDSLRIGDELIFYHIHCRATANEYNLQPMEFRISNQ